MRIAASRRRLGTLGADSRGVSALEFALALPLLAGFMLGGLELANYILAVNTTQRVATMMADMLSQVGVGEIATTEAQIYDMFYALDVAAKPLDLRRNGRVIFTIVRGETQANGTVANVFADSSYAQQFSGGYTAAAPLLGCNKSVARPAFNRVLPTSEVMAHVQVSFRYTPIFVPSAISLFEARRDITRTANFRLRKNRWAITNDSTHPPRNNCATASGL